MNIRRIVQQILLLTSPYKNGAGYEPSSKKDMKIIIDLLNVNKSDTIVDLGSGDGRIVLAVAKLGAKAVGIENDMELVKKSTDAIIRDHLQKKATIYYENFWNVHLHQFNKIVVFQYHTVMEKLEKKLLEEAQPGTIIISHHWKFPHLKITKAVKDIYLYIIP